MWRILPLLIGLLLWSPAQAQPQELAWSACHGAVVDGAPRLRDCRPLTGPIDPQGRDLWLTTAVQRPHDDEGQALHLFAVASSEAWLNGVRIGANGRPGATPATEIPGLYQTALPIPQTAWRSGANVLTVHMSSHHGPLRLDRPVSGLFVHPYPLPSRAIPLAITFIAAGALFAAAFGFGVIHALRRTGSSLTLAVIAGIAGLQAVLESLRTLTPYAYPLHAWRLVGIWALASAFSVLLVAWATTRFRPSSRRAMVSLTLVAIAATSLLPGFDLKTSTALLIGMVLAAVAAVMGIRRRRPMAGLTLTYLGLFLILAVAFPNWLVDLSYFLFAAGLVLPLLAVEVVRLGRDDRQREAALTQAIAQPDCLTVVSARGVERAPLTDIAAILGADDYVELRLNSGRALLHAARLDRLEADLPTGFLRVHRSAIANLAQATGLERDGARWRLTMRVGSALPISRARLAAVRAAMDA